MESTQKVTIQKGTSLNKVSKAALENNEMLSLLLKDVKSISFHNYLDFDGDLREKHYVVGISQFVNEKINKNNWGLAKYNEKVYLYNGQYWKSLEQDDIKKFLIQVATALGYEKTNAKYFAFANKLFDQFYFDSSLASPNLDTNKATINLQNGTYTISEGSQDLESFNQKDFLTYQLNFKYLATAKCPKFEKYLDRVLPDKASQNIIAEYIGYALVRTLKIEKCLMLYGSGANGKSVMFDIINSLIGKENINNDSLGNLSSEYNRVNLDNKILNYASEIGDSISPDLFKQLVSGEPISARLPYGNPMTIRTYAKLMFNCNQLPKDVEHNEAFFRRFIIIPFKETISDNEKNPNLAKEIINEEMSGVFNWVLKGLNRVIKQRKFTKSELVEETINQYKKESDNVKMFIEEKQYTASFEKWKRLKEFYDEYRSYCIDVGYKPLNRLNFRRRIESTNIPYERKSEGMCFGVEIM